MTRWSRVNDLFHAALARAGDREAFLAVECGGDTALRDEVESLLRAHDANTPSTAGSLLAFGTRVGDYEITGFLAAGAMGKVYRARDTRLEREVALKILPAAFVSDPDRRARFEREARLLASLNHPNIATIYGFEEAPAALDSARAGETGRSVHALALELVEGETLAERIGRGRIPLDEVLGIARQIAEALEAAHEQGIIHRELKPANIKLTRDGVVKVLDFGLAKLTLPDSGVGTPAPSSAAAGMTGARVLLGTPAYMSPEQARGNAADKRADIWGFGCVLFEMLTGERVFGGDEIADVLARVLEREPDWAALPGTTPPAVKRLLQRCLDKDLKRRLHDIADARIEIEDLLSSASRTPSETTVVDPQRRPVHQPWSLAALASLLALVTVGALTWYVRTAPQTQTTPRVSRLTMATSGAAAVNIDGNERHLAITPDGTRVIYIGNNNGQLFVRPLDRLDSTAVFTSVAPLNWVFVSPDGQWVGFQEGGTLRKVALTGGPVVTVVPGRVGGGATWAPDDTIIFSSADPTIGLQRVSAGGGDVTVLTRPDPARGEQAHLWPEVLPGGRAVLFTVTATTGGLAAAQVAVLDLVTGASTTLVRGGSHAQYAASGHVVYRAEGSLHAVPFDLTQLKTSGTLVTTPERVSDFVLTADGTLAYAGEGGAAAPARTLVWVDRQGREAALGAPAGPYLHPRVSPDGTRVAVVRFEQGGDIWVWDSTRERLDRMTLGPAQEFFPTWTPDGRRLVFSRVDGAGLFWLAADGAVAEEALGSAGIASGVTPDGARVVFSREGRDLMMLALDGTRPPAGSGRGEPVQRRVEPLLETPFTERNGVVSPDGRWLAYESDSSGRFEIYVRPFPDVRAGQWLISTAGGTRPLWAPSGQELFYVGSDGALMAVRVEARGSAWGASSPARVVEGPYLTMGGNAGRTYDVSADGRRFFMVKQPNPAAAPQIIIVQHWVEELKRLVPTK
jgi:serine/threonine-protein kinase